jgi:hypothetical protein
VFVKNANDFALDSMAADKLLIKVFDYRGVSYTKSIRLNGLPNLKIMAAAKACGVTLTSTRSLAPTPTLYKFSDDLRQWLLRMEPELTMCIKGVLNKLLQSDLEISPMRDNAYFDLIDEYFDTAAKGCSKTERPYRCGTFGIIDGDVNNWRKREDAESLEISLISRLFSLGQKFSTYSLKREYITTCGDISLSQETPYR